jgi:hypothetical protein
MSVGHDIFLKEQFSKEQPILDKKKGSLNNFDVDDGGASK